MTLKIIEAESSHIYELAQMAQILYDEEDSKLLEKEFRQTLTSEKDKVLVALFQEECAGFIHMALRHEFVEGAESLPVAYMEGIYVHSKFRRKNTASRLVEAGEKWAVQKGCTQIASDAEIDNITSHVFHERTGFKEANRLICYIKNI